MSHISNNQYEEGCKMNMQEIKGIANKMGVKTGKMKKSESIRAIQEAERNPACFDTGKANECGQDKCLWREDCK
jgi:hypothetical protein